VAVEMCNHTHRSSLRQTSHIVVSLNVAIVKWCKEFCACFGIVLFLLHNTPSTNCSATI